MATTSCRLASSFAKRSALARKAYSSRPGSPNKLTALMASDFPPAAVKPLAEEVAALLKERKETVTIAETVRQPA